ncbi:histidine phosphatase family protein [Pediococcus siamensis]|uniref:histidine phosphatase family protein n=1 Tax=Pediococcus siamensis TaxID=381829 RepID=UPI0039A0B533
MKTFDVYFVRHGQTFFNRYNRMQGWSDSPLTEKGWQDAEKVGQKFADIKLNAIYSSDTTRAFNTAKTIAHSNKSPGLTVHQLAEFREEFYGYFEGADSAQTWFQVLKPVSQARNFHDFLLHHDISESKNAVKAADPFHDAEDHFDFWKRLDKGFQYLITHSHDHDKILVVSHGTTIRSIVGRYAPDIDITTSPSNGSVTKLTIQDSQISVDYFNDNDEIIK